jgi:hypothetical protein
MAAEKRAPSSDNYVAIPRWFWQDPAYRSIRKASSAALLLFLYLLSNAHSRLIGIYQLPVDYALVDLGWSSDEFEAAMAELSALRVVFWDPERQYVFVKDYFQLCTLQRRQRLSPKDSRLSTVCKQLEALPSEAMRQSFLTRYGEATGLRQDGTPTGGDGPVGQEEGEGDGEGEGEANTKPMSTNDTIKNQALDR